MKTIIGTQVAHVTHDSDTTFKIKRSKVNLQGSGVYCGGLSHSLFGLARKCIDGYNLASSSFQPKVLRKKYIIK